MYHANTPSHNKEVFDRMQKPDGVVRVVFATVALGMEINFASLNTTMHYGSIEQASKTICKRVDM